MLNIFEIKETVKILSDALLKAVVKYLSVENKIRLAIPEFVFLFFKISIVKTVEC